MADTHKRRADKLAAKVVEARAVLALFDALTIAEILRRGERAAIPDGMNPVSLEAAGGTAESTSVEAHALRGLTEDGDDNWNRHIQPDPIGEYIAEIFQRLDEVFDNVRILDKRRQVVVFSADGLKGRQPAIDYCQACKRVVPGSAVDRLRSGYCDRVADVDWSGCYRMWLEQGRPDRLAFERWITNAMMTQAEKLARVAALARHKSGAVAKLPAAKLPNSDIERPKTA